MDISAQISNFEFRSDEQQFFKKLSIGFRCWSGPKRAHRVQWNVATRASWNGDLWPWTLQSGGGATYHVDGCDAGERLTREEVALALDDAGVHGVSVAIPIGSSILRRRSCTCAAAPTPTSGSVGLLDPIYIHTLHSVLIAHLQMIN